ncbi:hypothetical protein [Flavobacterium sp.]|uniref:hypothetical protein n=1 Tax=Flavobacterium sp. TaxID=239 RepID=UPI00262A68DE|nr:hypothetical protein [Flavobacterium sp.]
MKKKVTILVLSLVQVFIYACPVCERNQPKILRGIVHGAGPESNWDYVSIWTTIIIALITLFYSVKWTIKPGEKNTNHIKYSILK